MASLFKHTTHDLSHRLLARLGICWYNPQPFICVMVSLSNYILRPLRQAQGDKLRDVMVSLSNHEPSFDKLMTSLASAHF